MLPSSSILKNALCIKMIFTHCFLIVQIHETWNDTIDLYDGHTSGECSHFCSPGGYNIWLWSFWRLLLRLGGELQRRWGAPLLAHAAAAVWLLPP